VIGSGCATGFAAAKVSTIFLAIGITGSRIADQTKLGSLPCQAYLVPVVMKKGGYNGNFPFGGRAHWHRTGWLGRVPSKAKKYTSII
jgi:hypothetical protein